MALKVKGSFDVFGNIAIVKFPSDAKASEKKKFALDLMKENKAIKTVVEKVGKFQGRLRKQKTRHLAGEKTKEALYRENGCVFRMNIDDTYFSSRLSGERKEVAGKIKKGDKVLVMFAGISPFSIVIAKLSKASIVYSNELNRKANEYGKINIERNKLKGKVILVPGDIKKVAKKLIEKENARKLEIFGATKSKTAPSRRSRSKDFVGFDVIVMPRPQLKDSFLEQAFSLSKRGTRIFYYDFCREGEFDSVIDKVRSEAKKARKKVKIFSVKKAGETAPYKYRIRVDFRIL